MRYLLKYTSNSVADVSKMEGEVYMHFEYPHMHTGELVHQLSTDLQYFTYAYTCVEVFI